MSIRQQLGWYPMYEIKWPKMDDPYANSQFLTNQIQILHSYPLGSQTDCKSILNSQICIFSNNYQLKST